MPAWFRQPPPPHQAALAMIGAKPGGRVLVIGARYPGVAAEVARTTGLAGQTLVICAPADRPAVDAAAGQAGTLVEIEERDGPDLAVAGEPFDLVVWMEALTLREPAERLSRVRQAFATLRPGGRVVVIEGTKTSGLFKRTTPSLDSASAVALLTSGGLLAARDLGTIGGLSYFEGRKAR